MLKEYKPSEIDSLKIHGRRTACLDPVTLFWTGSGIEMNIRANVVKLRCRADYSAFEPWIDVLVEGVRRLRMVIMLLGTDGKDDA